MSMSQVGYENRISTLPDELLCNILSCLDIQSAVRTTVLSPRWKNLWTSLHNLWFCSEDFTHPSVDDSFMTFVDRVLFFRESSDIKKFYLDCKDSNDVGISRIESWICAAVRRNVVELNLCVDMLDFTQSFELPHSLFMCKTLEVLSLNSNFIASPPKSGCFPCLKVLEVLVNYPACDNSSLGQIFSNCPVLEDLRIEGALGAADEVLVFNISAPQLKRLTLELFVDEFENEMYNFYINAPKLEVFNLSKGDSSVYSFEINAKSLFKANVDLHSCCEHIAGTNGLLEAISNVKQLSLSTRKLEGGVPAFENLNHLELTVFGFTGWRYLIKFLKRSRNLEYLGIKHIPRKHDDFTPPEFVPACMLSHLKTITIRNFKGRQDEMRAAQYLLKHSEVLNEMTVFTDSAGLSRAEEKALFQEFLMFEQGSKTCQVKII